MKKFLNNTDWQPGQHLLVAGALRYGEYGYYKETILKQQVLRDRAMQNPGEDQEFTDWDSLGREVDAFLAA